MKTLIMKTLKIKLGLFSLLAILTVSVFFTSCEETEIVTKNADLDKPVTFTEDLNGGIHILPPKGFDNKTNEEQRLFFKELSDEDAQKLAENYRVFDYLTAKGITENADALLGEGELFSELDFSDILSTYQQEEMNDHEVNTIDSRDCYWEWVSCYYANGWFPRGLKVFGLFCSYDGFIGYYLSDYYISYTSCE